MTAAVGALVRQVSGLLWALLSVSYALDDASAAAPVHARVLHVVDGTTLDVLVGQNRTRIVLSAIEVSEAGRSHAQRSRQSLIQICGGELAEIKSTGKDREGRMLAQVVCNGTDANAEQVRRGMARLADRGTRPDAALHAAQEEARAAHRGLWAEVQASP